MDDSKLLELAGLAAGETYTPEHNPLDRDDLALRLAVKLKLSVWFEERESHQWTHIIWVSPVFEPYVGDVNAATRRAIVRAAAEIGRNMK